MNNILVSRDISQLVMITYTAEDLISSVVFQLFRACVMKSSVLFCKFTNLFYLNKIYFFFYRSTIFQNDYHKVKNNINTLKNELNMSKFQCLMN